MSVSFAVGRRGTNSTLQSNFPNSPRHSVGNINNTINNNNKRFSIGSVNSNNTRVSIGSINNINNNNKRLSCGSIYNINNNNKRLNNVVNNNRRLSIGNVTIGVDDSFVKEPSGSVVIHNDINENIRSTNNNVDQGSNCDFKLNKRKSEKSKKGAVGSSNKTKVSKSWPIYPDSKTCSGNLLKSSSSWTSHISSNKHLPLWPKSRQQQTSLTSPHILATLTHSETKSRLHLKSSVPKIMISIPSIDEKHPKN